MSVTKRDQELMTVVEEEALAAANSMANPKLIVQPHSKRSKIGRKIFCCCVSRKHQPLSVEIEIDQLQEATINGEHAQAEGNNAMTSQDVDREAQMIGFQRDASSIIDQDMQENVKSSLDETDKNRDSIKLSRNLIQKSDQQLEPTSSAD